jgi:hypothetical protein
MWQAVAFSSPVRPALPYHPGRPEKSRRRADLGIVKFRVAEAPGDVGELDPPLTSLPNPHPSQLGH